jgi:SHS2 domain-containing protein
MDEYEFNITVTGMGRDVDEAFASALELLAENPFDVIKGEVVYVNKTTVEAEVENDEAEDDLVN